MKRIFFVLIIVWILCSCTPRPPAQTGTPSLPAFSPSPSETVSVTPEPSPPLLTSEVDLPGYKTFVSGGKGENVTKDITTGDLEHFFTLEPPELLSLLGGEYEDAGFVDDASAYVYHYDTLNISLFYEYAGEKPVLPLKAVKILEPQFRGLTKESDFQDIMGQIGKTRVFKNPAEDAYYYALEYKIGKLLFEFGSEEEDGNGEDGISLAVFPVKEYEKYSPVDVKEIDRWFALPKNELIDLLGADYTVDEEESGVSGLYNGYAYKGKGVTLLFEQDRLAELELDGRYQVGGDKKAETYADIQKILGKGVLDESEGYYTLTYTYENFKMDFSSLEEDGFNYDMDILSILQ